MCRLELVFDGVSGRARVAPDDEQMIVRPDYDRRKSEQSDRPNGPERRRLDRRRRVTIH